MITALDCIFKSLSDGSINSIMHNSTWIVFHASKSPLTTAVQFSNEICSLTGLCLLKRISLNFYILNHFEDILYHINFPVITWYWDSAGDWHCSHWNRWACPSYIAITMAVDGLVMQGVIASAGRVLDTISTEHSIACMTSLRQVMIFQMILAQTISIVLWI